MHSLELYNVYFLCSLIIGSRNQFIRSKCFNYWQYLTFTQITYIDASWVYCFLYDFLALKIALWIIFSIAAIRLLLSHFLSYCIINYIWCCAKLKKIIKRKKISDLHTPSSNPNHHIWLIFLRILPNSSLKLNYRPNY